MYDVALKKAYKTAFDFIMPTLTVTKNIPSQRLSLAGIRLQCTDTTVQSMA